MKAVRRISVGSQNQSKIEAVKEIIQDYSHLVGASVNAVPADSGVSAQPTSLDETIRGAINRAHQAFHDCEYAIGLESGLMQVPHTKSGYLDVCVCVIYDGKQEHLGLSSAWEFSDPAITTMILKGGYDMSQAVIKMGMTSNPSIGAAEGAIGLITKGRLNRKDYAKQALRTALIHLDP